MAKVTDAEKVKQMQIQQYWLDYTLLREALRRLEMKAAEAWGRQIAVPLDGSQRSMRQLRQELEALEVGFSSDE